MRVLAVGDVPSRYYYDFYTPGKLDKFDIILSAGDLSRPYLEFLATMANRPLVYVRGNHDDSFSKAPPEGCICADGRIVVCNGLRILGLGGSYRYRDGENMYTEKQMRRRVLRLQLQLKRYGGFDILLSHAPARGINDMETLSHRGFECFTSLLEKYEPAYFVHGHIHRCYGPHIPQLTTWHGTTVINACDHCEFEI